MDKRPTRLYIDEVPGLLPIKEEEEEEEEMNFIETHDSYKKLRQKNIAYTIMRLYIQYVQ